MCPDRAPAQVSKVIYHTLNRNLIQYLKMPRHGRDKYTLTYYAHIAIVLQCSIKF